jgi:hypothetical protein
MGMEDFRRCVLPKEGDTVDIDKSQSKTVFVRYPRTVKEAMVNASATEGCTKASTGLFSRT